MEARTFRANGSGSTTRRLAKAADLVGIRLIDHLILGATDRRVSLRNRAW
jgi:DNA repair protein RadC